MVRVNPLEDGVNPVEHGGLTTDPRYREDCGVNASPCGLSGWIGYQEFDAMATVEYVQQLAFPRLSDSEIECLAGLATTCSFTDGELVFQAGQRGVPFYVVESGGIAIVDESTESRRRSSSTARTSSQATSRC